MNKTNTLPNYFSPNKLSELRLYFFALDLLCEHYFRYKEGDVDWKEYNGWEFANDDSYIIIRYSYENLIDREHPSWEAATIKVTFMELTAFWLRCVNTYKEVNKILDNKK